MKREPSSRFEIEAWGATDVGMKRRLNEDVFLIDHDTGIYLVADGMGGHAAGEVASRVAADKIVHTFKEKPADDNETWPEHWDPDRSPSANLMVDSILAAHYQVTQAMEDDSYVLGVKLPKGKGGVWFSDDDSVIFGKEIFCAFPKSASNFFTE